MPDRPGMGATKELNDYWLHGPGLAKWATSPTPFRTLVALLMEHMTREKAEGYAAQLYRAHFGRWPGRH